MMYMSYTPNDSWTPHSTQVRADAFAEAALAAMRCEAATEGWEMGVELVVYRLVAMRRLGLTVKDTGWTAEMVDVPDATAARIALLEHDLAVASGSITPEGWTRTRHGLDHIETRSEVYLRSDGQFRWSAHDGSVMPLNRGVAPTLAAGVRAVEEVLRA